MTLRALGALGALREDARVLGVGAGHEATIYWLTRKVGRVVATDRYEVEDHWSGTGDSGADMLSEPGRYWDGLWNPDRLEVLNMDALSLEFEDESFDDLLVQLDRALRGLRRRPPGRRGDVPGAAAGGVAALSTEFRIEGPGLATRASCASTSPSCGACSWMGSGGPRRPDRHDDLTETLAAPYRWRRRSPTTGPESGVEPLPPHRLERPRLPVHEHPRCPGQVGADRVGVAAPGTRPPAEAQAAGPELGGWFAPRPRGSRGRRAPSSPRPPRRRSSPSSPASAPCWDRPRPPRCRRSRELRVDPDVVVGTEADAGESRVDEVPDRSVRRRSRSRSPPGSSSWSISHIASTYSFA